MFLPQGFFLLLALYSTQYAQTLDRPKFGLQTESPARNYPHLLIVLRVEFSVFHNISLSVRKFESCLWGNIGQPNLASFGILKPICLLLYCRLP